MPSFLPRLALPLAMIPALLLAPSSCKTSHSSVQDSNTEQVLGRLPPGLGVQTVPSDGIEKYVQPFKATGSMPTTFNGVWWLAGPSGTGQFVFTVHNSIWTPLTNTLTLIGQMPNACAQPVGMTVDSPMIYSPSTLPSGYSITFAPGMKSATLSDLAFFSQGTSQASSSSQLDNLPKLTYVSDAEWTQSAADGSSPVRLRRIVQANGTRDPAYNDYLSAFGTQASVYVPALVVSKVGAPLNFMANASGLGTVVLINGAGMQLPVPGSGQFCDPLNPNSCFPYCSGSGLEEGDDWAFENGALCRATGGVSSGVYAITTAQSNIAITDSAFMTAPSNSAPGGQTTLLAMPNYALVPVLNVGAGGKGGPVSLHVTALPTAVLQPGATVTLQLAPGQVETAVRIISEGAPTIATLSAQGTKPFEMRLMSTGTINPTSPYDQTAATQTLNFRGKDQVVVLGASGGVPSTVTLTLAQPAPQVTARPAYVIDGPTVTYTLSSMSAFDSIPIQPTPAIVQATLAAQATQLPPGQTAQTALNIGDEYSAQFDITITNAGTQAAAAQVVSPNAFVLQNNLGAMQPLITQTHLRYQLSSLIVGYTGDPNATNPTLTYTVQIQTDKASGS